MRTGQILLVVVAVAGALAMPGSSRATGVPIGGFLPFVGLSLTDEFNDGSGLELEFFAEDEPSLVGNQLGTGGSPFYDLALLDLGAAVSLITDAADASFGIDAPFSGNPDGFRGTKFQTIGGATGFLDAIINDPLGTFISGTANRTTGPGGTLAFDTASFVGQSSVSILTIPPESDLPNIIGIPLLSRYTTFIRNDQPQIFQHNGRTVRTPNIEFHERGTGDQLGISRRVPVTLDAAAGFASQPIYIYDFEAVLNGDPLYENPQAPTILAEPGALFINVAVENDGQQLANSFFFDSGADVTVLSEFQASQLGFDVVLDEPEFTVAVVGSGGVNLEVPGFFVDEFTVEAIGGDITATNVPVIVFDVANPSDPGNVVDGIVGTNIFARRNVVVDPNPALGGGGPPPSLYVSDPVTTEKNWTSTAASGNWGTGGNWNGGTTPTTLGIANVRHVAGSDQTAIVDADVTVWELNVSGAGGAIMAVRVEDGVRLTTFSGVNIEPDGVIELAGGTLDAQFIEIVGGTLTGSGLVTTGSGPIPGQVENRAGTVAPGNSIGILEIDGRFANDSNGTLAIELGGNLAGTEYDQLVVDGAAALDGTLVVSLVDLGGGLFAPAIGNTFTVVTASDGLSGTFDQLLLPNGFNWQISYANSNVTLSVGLPGDFNNNGIVDAADYTVWRDGLGTTYTLADYDIWKANFGQTAGTGSGSLGATGSASAHAAVPEPATALLLIVPLAALLLFSHRGHREI